jgi:hypothetical protein
MAALTIGGLVILNGAAIIPPYSFALLVGADRDIVQLLYLTLNNVPSAPTILLERELSCGYLISGIRYFELSVLIRGRNSLEETGTSFNVFTLP